jgi:beta-galactosidase
MKRNVTTPVAVAIIPLSNPVRLSGYSERLVRRSLGEGGREESISLSADGHRAGSFAALRMTIWGTVAGLLAAISLPAAEIAWDNGWRFHLGDAPGAEAPGWADADWRTLDLPHDWSIEGKTSPAEPSAGGGGFFPTGIGWYRKTFKIPGEWRGQRVEIEFDGIYRHSEVWINGHSLGQRPSGFVRFAYDLTPHLTPVGENVIAVRVDNSEQPNSRWYAGSGIYRHVRLHVADPVHLTADGFFATTTALSAGEAEVRFNAEVRNSSDTSQDIAVEIVLIDPAGRNAGVVRTTGSVAPGGSVVLTANTTLADFWPWSPESPSLYRAVTRVFAGGRLTDHQEHPFGVRLVNISAERGFELNGVPLKLIGGNAHDDNGPLGVAAFDRAEERRAEQLKAAGFNAVRTAHNPPAPAFLDACDRLGLLVVCEAFDGWKSKKLAQDYGRDFDEWSERDLDAMIRMHRRHPSVVMWSIGNEPYERGKESGVAIAKNLADRIRQLDSSRPVTVGINGLGKSGAWSGVDPIFASLDVAGYNYEIAHHAEDHSRLPERVIMITESYHTEAFANWSILQAQPYVVGEFVWSALDYLGEAGIGRVFQPDEKVRPHWEGSHYPWHGAACGDIDLTGWRRPSSHYRNILWDRGETLYAAVREVAPDGRPLQPSLWSPPPLQASWTWPGQEGRELTVEVYSRHESVRLYLNDKLLGEKPTTRAEEFKAGFIVPYAPGSLRVVGVQSGREVETVTLTTAGAPAKLRLTADRTSLRADGQDLAFITVEVVDAAGRVVPQAQESVTYSLTGPAAIAGIGSADLTTTESYRANPRKVFQGRALAVIRSQSTAGEITVIATASGLPPARLQFKATLP